MSTNKKNNPIDWEIEYIQKIFDECINLLKLKNADYSGNRGFFDNFLTVEKLGITNAETGFLTRMTDKLSRVNTLLKNKNMGQVKDESIQDTLMDIINYSVLLIAFLEYRKKQKNNL